MKIKDLQKLLDEARDKMTKAEYDELEVLIPLNKDFDGIFVNPMYSGKWIC